MIVLMIIKYMKPNYIQYNYSHHLTINLQPVPKQRSWTPRFFAYSTKFQKKAKVPEKFAFPDKGGFELPENQKADNFLPMANAPFINGARCL